MSAACNFASSLHSAASCATAASAVMYDLVAATLVSSPAHNGSVSSAISASGEPSAFTSATTKAPASRAARVVTRRSGLRPDCEIARKRQSARSWRRVTDDTDGAADAVSTPRRVSKRYFA